MDKFKVVLIAKDNHEIPVWVGKKFADANIDFSFHDCFNREDLEKYASDADVLFLTSSRKDLVIEANMDIFKKAVYVIKCGSGTDNIDHRACIKKGILVAHTSNDPTEATSNHFIAMLFTAVQQTKAIEKVFKM